VLLLLLTGSGRRQVGVSGCCTVGPTITITGLTEAEADYARNKNKQGRYNIIIGKILWSVLCLFDRELFRSVRRLQYESFVECLQISTQRRCGWQGGLSGNRDALDVFGDNEKFSNMFHYCGLVGDFSILMKQSIAVQCSAVQ
jgi:hypothetical protein